MEMEVRRELQRSILTAEIDMPENTEQYKFRMIKDNHIPGLLECSCQHIDGRLRIVFDITGWQSLREYWNGREIPGEEIHWIFEAILNTFEQTGKYLLSGEDLILSPDYIYIDPRKRETALCYIPGRNTEIFREFHTLTEYFLQRAGHDDREAVMLIYELYRLTSQEQYDLQELKRALMNSKADNPPLIRGSMPEKVTMRDHPPKQEQSVSYSEFYSEQEDQWEDEEYMYFDLEEEEVENTPSQKPSLKQTLRHAYTEKPEFRKDDRKERLKLRGREYKKGAAAVTIILAAAAVIWLIKAGAFYGENGLKLGAGFLVASAVTAYIIVKGREESEEKEAQETYEYPAYSESNNQETTILRSRNPTTEQVSTCGWLRSSEQTDLCISSTPFYIGKQKSEVDGHINADTVSRKHARFDLKKQSYYLTDLKSTNGTKINGRKLKPGETVRLKEYDRITFADREFEFYVQ